jgi:peptidoglycan-associated lipoprotein
MRVWFLCLLASGLLIGCHHDPPKTFDEDKGSGHQIVVPDDQAKQNENKIGGSEIHESTLNQDLSQLRPVFFDYDKSDIRADQMEVLQTDAQILKQIGNKVQIQGHCDERGTEEYNLALGDRRARMVREYLNSLGIDAARLDTISYGESRPFATQHNEDAWSENRRAHFIEEH